MKSNIRHEVVVVVDVTVVVVVGVTTVVGVMVLVEVESTTTTDCVTDTTVATVTVLMGVGIPKHEQALEMSEQACGKPKQLWLRDVVFEMAGKTLLLVG